MRAEKTVVVVDVDRERVERVGAVPSSAVSNAVGKCAGEDWDPSAGAIGVPVARERGFDVWPCTGKELRTRDKHQGL